MGPREAFETICSEEILQPGISTFSATGNRVYLSEKVIKLYEGSQLIKELVPGQFFVLPSGIKGIFKTEKVQSLKYASFTNLALKLSDKPDAWANFLLRCSENYFTDIPREAEHTIVKFEAGEVLIEQGARDKDVYMLMEGEAEVLINDHCVGKILSQEIFGALAGLTDLPRTATVKSTMPGEALCVKQDDFSALLGHKPAITRKLINDLARALASTNQEVVSLQKIMRSMAKDGESVLGLT